MAMAPASGGYWEVASDGGIFAFGGAGFFGSMGGEHLNTPIVGMAATPDGGATGWWPPTAASSPSATPASSAPRAGSTLNRPVVGMSSTADGNGYRLVASDGGIFTFGDAALRRIDGRSAPQPTRSWPSVNDTNTGRLLGGGLRRRGLHLRRRSVLRLAPGRVRLNAPIVGMAETSNGSGYRFAASDGGVFSFVGPVPRVDGRDPAAPARSWAWPASDPRPSGPRRGRA